MMPRTLLARTFLLLALLVLLTTAAWLSLFRYICLLYTSRCV